MNLRPTQSAIFSQIQRDLAFNLRKLVRAQEQVASGKRIQRPSDDPIGSSKAMSLQRQISASDRYLGAVADGRVLLDTGAGILQEGTGLLADARAILVQGLNGTLNAQDRTLLADEVRLIRDRLLDIANSKSSSQFLFGGTHLESNPFQESTISGKSKVTYVGNDQVKSLQIGQSSTLAVTVAGDQIFARDERSGTSFTTSTGIQSGVSANEGTGFETLTLRHDATVATLSGGLSLVNGGVQDSILGTHTLTVDAVAGTVRLGSGPALAIPSPGSANVADFVIADEHGAQLHLDFSGFTGGSFSDSVVGAGSISIDGTNFVALSFAETDLQLVHAQSGSVLHVDTTQVHSAGSELVTFQGAVNVFDVLEGIAGDLSNTDGIALEDALERLGVWMGELDRNSANVLSGATQLGSRSAGATATAERLADSQTWMQATLSGVEDADYADVVLQMTRAEQTLQLTQATSVRLMQNSLLEFLR